MDNEASAQLAAGMDALELAYNPSMLDRLLQFRTLLAKWNKVYNLTGVRDPDKMLSYHLLDSLSVSPYVIGERVLDMGTGAGLPGIPLAMLHPERRFVLVDSNGKKTRFVRQALLELDLANVEVEQVRLENFTHDELFDTIVTRAFASVGEIISWSARLLSPDGRLLAMRGRLPETDLRYPGFCCRTVPVKVVGIEGERHILMMTPATKQSD